MGRQNNTPPAWFILLTTVALVLGGYYLMLGLRDYIRTGGLGVVEATAQAASQGTSTAVRRATDAIPTPTLIPTFTPVPDCEDWRVTVPSAIVRAAPSTSAPLVVVVDQGETVCVIRPVPDTDWYLVDTRPASTRIDEGYMRNDIIEPLNPTPTATLSPTPLPTVTPITPTATLTPTVTNTPDPSAPTATDIPPPTSTATPTPTPTATPLPLRST
ncbi:MAG: SH3 domain-containing protein [Chloroflexota bacterium]